MRRSQPPALRRSASYWRKPDGSRRNIQATRRSAPPPPSLVRHLSDVERAAKNVQQRNFPAAIEICANYLTRFPDHLLFGEFKREAELGQKLAYVEELQRRAAAETDLQKRAKILEEGLKRHPDEKTFADELRFTRNKLALVDSIVKKARAHEERGTLGQGPGRVE